MIIIGNVKIPANLLLKLDDYHAAWTDKIMLDLNREEMADYLIICCLF